jgi:integrase
MACVRKWRGKWVVDWRDPTGKRFIETVEGNRDDAERRLGEVVGSGKQAAPKRQTLEEYGKWWLENMARGTIKESTYREYESALRVHVNPILGPRPLAKINRKMIRELIALKKKDGLAQSTIKNILAPIRGMFNHAIDEGTAYMNPASRVGKQTKVNAGEPASGIDPLTREEIAAMLEKAAETIPHFYPFFLCAPRTGIRQGELISLKGTDIDFRGRFIHVQRNLSRGQITTPKNGKTRKVDMSAKLAEVLDAMLSRRRAAALEKEMEKPAGERRDAAAVVNAVMEDWLFQTPTGTQLDPSNVRKIFNKLLTSAKLRRVRFHDLRHTFASLLLGQGESLAYVKDQMGHSSINVTVDVYGHLVPGGNRAAVDKLDELPKAEVESETAAA